MLAFLLAYKWNILHLILELYLGRTTKIKANSVLDLVFLTLSSIFKFVKLKLSKGDKK